MSVGYEALVEFLYRAPIGLVQTSLDGAITMINPMSAQLLMPLAPTGNLENLFDALAPVAPHLRELAARPCTSGEYLVEELRIQLPPKDTLVGSAAHTTGHPPQTLAISLVRLDTGTLMGTIHDVTFVVAQEQSRLAVELHDASRVDQLTGMPTRPVLLERIERAIVRHSESSHSPFAVVFVNIDRFNRINVTHGLHTGDALLQLVAQRILRALRMRDALNGSQRHPDTLAASPSIAARLGSDEFVVLIDNFRSPEDVQTITQRLLDTLNAPYLIGDQTVHVAVSAGVVHGREVSSPDAILEDASLAMRQAKRAGGGRYSVFEPAIRERARKRGSLEADLRVALTSDQLFVVYQPIIALDTGCATGVEALVRWAHPERGVVYPGDFIEIAEETGLIDALGAFVLDAACRQAVRWNAQLGDAAPALLSVNLSRAQLKDPGIVDQVRRAVDGSGLRAGQLQLEVTESLAAQDQLVQSRLHELRNAGVSLALDDFGTGYSSHASLHLLPVDVVKIDRSFTSLAETSAHHRVLIEATVRVARSHGMRTVAEGVETEGQAQILRRLDCDKAQGYLYARPLSAEDATRWLHTRMESGSRERAATRAA